MIKNIKIDTYIENIKIYKFYEGIIEIGIFAKVFNINIIIYKKEDGNGKTYHHYINIIRNNNKSKYLLKNMKAIIKIYDFLYSKKLNTTKVNKINWKK